MRAWKPAWSITTTPMDLREGPMRLKVAYTDVSGTLNYFRRDTLLGHESKTTIGWRTTKHLPNSGASQFTRDGDVFGARTRDFTYQARTPCCMSATTWNWSRTCG